MRHYKYEISLPVSLLRSGFLFYHFTLYFIGDKQVPIIGLEEF